MEYQRRADRSGKIWVNVRNAVVRIEPSGDLVHYHGAILIAKAGWWRVKPPIPATFRRVGIQKAVKSNV